jgi:hypothetical protein
MKKILYPTICLLLFSCGKSEVPKNYEAKTMTEPYDCSIKIEEMNHYLMPKKPDKVSMLYVVNPNMANQYEKPDTNSAVLGKYQYGDNVWVDRLVDTTMNGKTSSWYLIDEYITKTTRVDYTDYSARVSALVFVKKEDLGAESNIMMTNDELYEDSDENGITSLRTKKHLSIQSLDHDEFYETPEPNHWIRKSYTWVYEAIVNKIDLRLTHADTSLQYKNDPYQEETDYHIYMEDMQGPNSYLIYAGYYEDHRFLLRDKGTGETKANLIGYPCISPNKKYIVSFYDCPYGWGAGNLEIHAITSKGPYKLLHSFGFINWRPFEDPMEFVWINEHEFKMKVYTLSKHFRKWEGKEFAPRTGYLKFRIK